MRLYVLELYSIPYVIWVQQLCDAGVSSPKLSNEGSDPYATGYHIMGSPWVMPSLLSKK